MTQSQTNPILLHWNEGKFDLLIIIFYGDRKKHPGKNHIGKKRTGKSAYVYKRMRKKFTRKEAH